MIFTLLLPELMNDTKFSPEEEQHFLHKNNDFLPYLNNLLVKMNKKTKERIEEAETELWLYLGKAVVHGFAEYDDLKDEKTAHTMSNVLLNMDDVFHKVQEERDE